ncbi:hypothetical protein KSP39_PZI007675 [Platanthera zijinensis]|uniref:Uncharacterized protein n=1 Tax=Platanthera zijinensis TaxID=2320716 RepID=A0AAP0BLK0_9ASPA
MKSAWRPACGGGGGGRRRPAAADWPPTGSGGGGRPNIFYVKEDLLPRAPVLDSVSARLPFPPTVRHQATATALLQCDGDASPGYDILRQLSHRAGTRLCSSATATPLSATEWSPPPVIIAAATARLTVIKLTTQSFYVVSLFPNGSLHLLFAPVNSSLLVLNTNASTISANINSIPILNGTNFKAWKENVQIVLGCMDLDLSLRTDRPQTLTDKSSPDEKRDFER